MTIKTLESLRDEDPFKFFGQPHIEREMNCLSVILNYPEDEKLPDSMKLVILKVM